MKTFAFTASAAYLLAQAQAAQFVQYTGTTVSDGDDNLVERADPILAPGILSQHVHQIFGANGFAPGATYDSLQDSTCTTVGAANGDSNIADKSIYWHPALYAEAKDNSGYVRIPTLGHKFYYQERGTGKRRQPFEFPHGFRMLAGNPFMRVAGDLTSQNITQWICHDSAGNNQGTDGGFPTGVTDCDAYPGFNGAIHFPHCWNGDDFNPADPTAHMAYPLDNIADGACPSSHPTVLPHIFAENQFNVHAMVGKFKPDTFTLAMGDPTGYGWHFDFYNGWDDGAIPQLFATCPQGEYGNEDIGGCPSLKRGKATNACPLKMSYKENVDTPGQYLPGCNPVSDTNPAPFYATSPLGTSSNNCKLASGGPPPSNPTTSKSTTRPTTKPTKTSTMLTTTKTGSPSKPTTTYPSTGSPSAISCPSSNHHTYTVNGKTFKVQCGVDHSGGDMKSVTAHSLAECVQACASTNGCVDVSLSGVACYMKSSLGAAMQNSGVNGAKLVTGSHHQRHLAKHIQRYAS